MRILSIAAMSAALVMSGCVAYPVDGYGDRGGAYRDGDGRYDRYDQRDRRDQDRDRHRDRDRDRDRDGDRHDFRGDRP